LAEDLVREERPLPLTEVRPPPPAPDLTPSLPEPETDPEVQNPPGGGAPSGDIREEMPVTNRPVTPPVEHNNPPVSTLPPPVSTPPDLERGQHTRQPPAYLKDFVCDCAESGKYESPAGCRTERLATKRGSCGHLRNSNFCPGGITNEIHPPEAKCPSHVS